MLCTRIGATLGWDCFRPCSNDAVFSSILRFYFACFVAACGPRPGRLLVSHAFAVCAAERRANAVRQRASDGHSTARTVPPLPRIRGTLRRVVLTLLSSCLGYVDRPPPGDPATERTGGAGGCGDPKMKRIGSLRFAAGELLRL